MDITNKSILNIVEKLEKYLQNKREAIILTLTSFFSNGHLLIEDLPGVGKTTLAIAVSKALGLSFGRIQCTPDLLPSDITGITIYNREKGEFIFNKGPIFNNVVLIDEINRTTQKTQSALLEAMEEEQVTVDRKTFNLPEPFFVIATQNPSEHYGTFSLPDSQMDRFIMNISIGYPHKAMEVEILKRGSIRKDMENISPVLSKSELTNIKEKISEIYVSEKILFYIVDIVNATRKNKYLQTGISPRGSIALLNSCKTFAFFNNKDFVAPDHVKLLAPYVFSHRIIAKEEYSSFDKREIIRETVKNVQLPV